MTPLCRSSGACGRCAVHRLGGTDACESQGAAAWEEGCVSFVSCCVYGQPGVRVGVYVCVCVCVCEGVGVGLV